MKKVICSKGFLKVYFPPWYFQNILPKFGTLTEKSTPFNGNCVKFTAIFSETNNFP